MKKKKLTRSVAFRTNLKNFLQFRKRSFLRSRSTKFSQKQQKNFRLFASQLSKNREDFRFRFQKHFIRFQHFSTNFFWFVFRFKKHIFFLVSFWLVFRFKKHISFLIFCFSVLEQYRHQIHWNIWLWFFRFRWRVLFFLHLIFEHFFFRFWRFSCYLSFWR